MNAPRLGVALVPGLVLAIDLLASGCTVSSSRRSTKAGVPLSAHTLASTNSGAGASIESGSVAVALGGGGDLEEIAKRSPYSRGRAESYLEAARAYLSEGRPADALRCAHGARHSYPGGLVEGRAYRLLGEAHLAGGQYELAERYLRKGLENATGSERERALARLIVTLRTTGADRDAQALERQLSKPLAGDVRRILESRPPPLVASPGARLAQGAPVAPAPGDPGGYVDLGVLPPLKVLPRSSWGARPVITSRSEPMGPIRRLTIHHSGEDEDFEAQSRAATAQKIRGIQRHHQRRLGWADIGYHYVVDRRGEVWQGRALTYQGAHAKGLANLGNIGIVVLGNYGANRQRLNEAQQQSLAVLTAKLCEHYGIPASQVFTHQEIRPGPTDCPGRDISAYVARLRRSIERWQLALAAARARARPASFRGN